MVVSTDLLKSSRCNHMEKEQKKRQLPLLRGRKDDKQLSSDFSSGNFYTHWQLMFAFPKYTVSVFHRWIYIKQNIFKVILPYHVFLVLHIRFEY